MIYILLRRQYDVIRTCTGSDVLINELLMHVIRIPHNRKYCLTLVTTMSRCESICNKLRFSVENSLYTLIIKWTRKQEIFYTVCMGCKIIFVTYF